MPDLLERLGAALADRYAVESEIGRGGMAVVFLAEDLKHHRKVALKVLHPDLSATLGAERFLKEIEIAAGLQHPHILPLYDSGEADGLLYYAMPFAEGESLRGRLDRERQLPVDESVRIAVEVADGLDYAHRKGVIHRDIKPGNILLSGRHAVIADFGIARAVDVARRERLTGTGLGVGTPLYASPEQATAQETLDGRTDIYSLGCVLYEMLAGEPPLSGATPQRIQARRMSETPTPIHTYRDTVPPGLDHVIARALARLPADRYATASQFAQALQAVLLASTPSLQADPYGTPTAAPAGGRAGPAATSRRWWWLLAPVLAAVLLAIVWRAGGWSTGAALEITTSNIEQVTYAPGIEFQPAISPSGADVAYIAGPLWNAHLEIRSAAETGSTGVARPDEDEDRRSVEWLPQWTPDGMSVRFRSCAYTYVWLCVWKEVGKYGGATTTLATPAGYPARQSLLPYYVSSPDGSRLVFGIRDSIYAATDPDAERELLGVHTAHPWEPHSFAWSPDGRRVAYVNGNPQWRFSANVARSSIWILDAQGGEPIQITDEERLNVSPQWLPDSRHLLFVSDRDGPREVYVVEVSPKGPKGSPRHVPGPSDPHSISLSSDGTRIAWAKLTLSQNIRSVAIPDSGLVSLSEAVPVTRGNRVIEDQDVTRDGEWLAFSGSVRGTASIFKRPTGGGADQVVVDPEYHAFDPRWSPDGTEIAFHSGRPNLTADIFVVSATGGVPQRVTDFPGQEQDNVWSADGRTLAFRSQGPAGEGPYRVWTVERDSVGAPWGEPEQLTDIPCMPQDWAPDGSGLLCRRSARESLLLSPTGEVLDRFETGPVLSTRFRYSPDGSWLYFWCMDPTGWGGICRMPSGGGEVTKVVNTGDVPTMEIFNIMPYGFAPLSVGPDKIYLTVSVYDSDIWAADLEW